MSTEENAMKLDVAIMNNTLRDSVALAEAAEAIGFDTLWTSETQHDPFLPLGVAALHTRRIGLGTAIAVAFARNPMSTAYLAWDLQEASGGRFILGLGTQVQATSNGALACRGPRPRPGYASSSWRCVLSGTSGRTKQN